MASRDAPGGSRMKPLPNRSTPRIRASLAVREAAEELADSGVPEPEASAEILLSELLGIRRGELAFHDVSAENLRIYSSHISRRKEREPVQRILGYAYFRNLKLFLRNPDPESGSGSRIAPTAAPEASEDEVSPLRKSAASREGATHLDMEPRLVFTGLAGSEASTLIPRSDTESVVEAALGRMDERGYPCRVLDIGTGSGAIAISIAQERPRCEVHASDVSEAALRVAKRNAEENGVKVEFHLSDIVGGLENLAGSFDLLVSNPPYIKSGDIPNLEPEVRDHDPISALDGGPDGLDFYRRIFAETPPLLKKGADVVLEVGDGQSEAVLELGRSAGFTPIGVCDDLAGTPRVVLSRWDG
ncbi:MAG: peptide chain release factor N(5)-glutamine methyltransferase [Rubrobacteraceae bacterium]